jgi:hypothetical protein
MSNVTLLDNPVLKYRPNSSVPVNIGAVAKRIAAHLGGKMLEATEVSGEVYYVPFAAVHADLAIDRGIKGLGSLYGGIVREHQHADKAILHTLPSMDADHPSWYSRAFAEAVRDVVLPGYTAFTQEDLACGFDLMRADGLSVRLKDPANTGGLGQYTIGSRNDLASVMSDYAGKISKTGMVLEADLHGPVTITIGYVNIKGETYTWHGRPYDVKHDGMTRFGGNELLVVRGGLDVLYAHSTDPHDRLAIAQVKRTLKAYSLLGAHISRATLDVVQGTSCEGEFLSGVTDPSLRPSASSAAEIRAIEALTANPKATVATARLKYDYEKSSARTPEQELFVDHSRMNILVELIGVL